MLYAKKKLDAPVVLKDAVVVLKRGRYGVIKQHPDGRGIFVFGAVRGLKEGQKYDLKVQETGSYRGLKEVTAMLKLKEKGYVDLSRYYASLKKMRQNEVVRNLTGTFKNGYFYVNGEKIPIYFKNRKATPRNGAKIKIDVAHIGYYKKMQLVVYSRKDFMILEN